MPKDRRATMAAVASRNGWNFYDDYPGPARDLAPRTEWVAYFRSGEQVLIAWTTENTPEYAARISDVENLETASGTTALITVRGWFEARCSVSV